MRKNENGQRGRIEKRVEEDGMKKRKEYEEKDERGRKGHKNVGGGKDGRSRWREEGDMKKKEDNEGEMKEETEGKDMRRKKCNRREE